MEKLFTEKINRNLFITLMVLLCLLVFVNVLNQLSDLRNPSYAADQTIAVSAEGEVFAIPDVAEFSYTVSEQAETLDQAQNLVAEKINQTIELLEEEGVAEEKLQTTNYYSNPVYARSQSQINFPRLPQEERTIVGYQVSQSMSFELEDLDLINAVISGLGDLQLSNISGPNFTFSNEEELLEEARKQAIDKAKDKARQLASDLGVRLGSIVDFNENRNFAYPMARMESAAFDDGAADISIPAGENEISSSVNIVFRIR